MLVQQHSACHMVADGISYSFINKSLLGANTAYPTNPDIGSRVCGCPLPASVLQAPT